MPAAATAATTRRRATRKTLAGSAIVSASAPSRSVAGIANGGEAGTRSQRSRPAPEGETLVEVEAARPGRGGEDGEEDKEDREKRESDERVDPRVPRAGAGARSHGLPTAGAI